MATNQPSKEPFYEGNWLRHNICANAIELALARQDLDWRGFDVFDVASLVHELQIEFQDYAGREAVEYPEKLVWEFANKVVRHRVRYASYRRHRKLKEEHVKAGKGGPSPAWERAEELRQRLAAVRAALTDEQRLIVDFILERGLDIDDEWDRAVIARRFGKSAAALSVILHRIRRRAQDAEVCHFGCALRDFWKSPDDRAARVLDDRARTDQEAGLVCNTLTLYREGHLLAASRTRDSEGVSIPDRLLHVFTSHADRSQAHARRLGDPYLRGVAEWDRTSAAHYEAIKRGKVEQEVILNGYQRAAEGFLQAGRREELACVFVAQAAGGLGLGDPVTPILLLDLGVSLFEGAGYRPGAAALSAARSGENASISRFWHENWHGASPPWDRFGGRSPPDSRYWPSLQHGIAWGLSRFAPH